MASSSLSGPMCNRGTAGAGRTAARPTCILAREARSWNPVPSVRDLDDHLDLDGAVARELVDADGAAGVPARLLPEDLHQGVGGAVDNGRGVEEALAAVHHAEELHHAGDL